MKFLLIESPRPVPPYLRLMLPSTCLKASKIRESFSCGIPIPVSLTSKIMFCLSCFMLNSTEPSFVNLKELDNRFLTT